MDRIQAHCERLRYMDAILSDRSCLATPQLVSQPERPSLDLGCLPMTAPNWRLHCDIMGRSHPCSRPHAEWPSDVQDNARNPGG